MHHARANGSRGLRVTLACAVVLLVACGTPVVPPGHDHLDAAAVEIGTDDPAKPGDAPGEATDLPFADQAVDVLPETACEPGNGSFGCPCANPADCASGWCVVHLGGKVCSRACLDSCPEGWTCSTISGTDQQYVCVSRFTTLCLPCTSDLDCVDAAGHQDACLDYGDALGRFCGAACGPELPCPAAFECRATQRWNAAPTTGCVKTDGRCPCSPEAVASGASTVCHVANAVGDCWGRRVCTADGPTGCDARVPVGEVVGTATCVNGVDDDCDGSTDPAETCTACVCGDGHCEPERCGERWDASGLTCAVDCAACGNGMCDPGESAAGTNACVADCCGACGDGTCKGGERQEQGHRKVPRSMTPRPLEGSVVTKSP